MSLGWAIVMAPWLAKNVIDTGNPVYPLGYRVFHGRNWDEPARRSGNMPTAHGRSTLQALLELAGRRRRPVRLAVAALRRARPAGLCSGAARDDWRWRLGGYAAYLFLTWWLLTHRLDRFWLPLLPCLAILAGLGADWSRDGLAHPPGADPRDWRSSATSSIAPPP